MRRYIPPTLVHESVVNFESPKKGTLIVDNDSIKRRIGLEGKILNVVAQQGQSYIAEITVGGSIEAVKIPKSFIKIIG